MTRILLILLLLTLPAISSAKVYTNSDLKPEPPIKSPSPPVSQPHQQQSRDSHGPVSNNGHEQREPLSKPNRGATVQPQSNANVYPRPNINKPLPQPKPDNATPETSFDRILDKAFTNITVFMLIIYAVPFLIAIICLIDILRNEFPGHNKMIWFLVVFLLPLIGSVLYFFIGTDQKVKPKIKEEQVERLI
jgi:Phospholipase_D-nuclease N-terminal